MTASSHAVRARPLDRGEAAVLMGTEYRRFIELVGHLRPEDWARPTDCPAWTVREMTAHVLGMMAFVSSPHEFVRQFRAGQRAAGDRPQIDGMTEIQVRERAHLGPAEIVAGLTAMAPRAERGRRRVPGPLRRLPMKGEFEGAHETWTLGYLLDVILTRDVWMHRADICRAVGSPPALTADHDGRLVADVVAEWARRHGSPFDLTLHGPAGGRFTQGSGGEAIALDAVDFCRILSGRGTGPGLLTQKVPF